MTEAVCAACGHHIDPSARLCPYCTADPRTGEKPIDTQALVQEVFRPREITTSESVIEYARQRQGVVIAAAVFMIFIGLALLHQFVTGRNNADMSPAPPVPLTEVTDLSNQAGQDQVVPIPDLEFQHSGQPQRMKTFIVEEGAVTPPEVVAAQQAAQQPQQGAAPPQQPPAQ